MAIPEISTPSPVFEYTLRQRAAMQVLTDALRHIAADPDAGDVEAAWMLWGCREVIAMEGLRLPREPRRKPLSIIWRNPQKAVQ